MHNPSKAPILPLPHRQNGCKYVLKFFRTFLIKKIRESMKFLFFGCLLVCSSSFCVYSFAPNVIPRAFGASVYNLQRRSLIGCKPIQPRRGSFSLNIRASNQAQDEEWKKFEDGVQQLQQGLQQLQSGLGLAAEGALNGLGKSALVNMEVLLGKEEFIGRLEAAQSVVLKNIGIGEVI
jgi:X-X-X-Leu-X-X-Gly heptad repeat protein